MNEFRLRFEGLVGYVPLRDPGDETPPQGVLMVMPNLGAPKKIRTGSLQNIDCGFTPPPHVSALVVEKRFVDPRSDLSILPSFVFEKDNRHFAVYQFFFENLSYRKPGGSAALKLKAEIKKTQLLPKDSTEENDLRWVPSLSASEIKGAGIFNRNLVSEKLVPSKDSGGLIGTIKLEWGIFQALGVHKNAKGEPILFDFSYVSEDEEIKPPKKYSQATAFGTENLIETNDDRLELIWNDGSTARTLVLRTVADEKVVPATIYNRELEQILGIGSPTSNITKWDLDPAVFYHISLMGSDKELLPVSELPAVGRARPGCDAPSFDAWAKG